MSKRRHGSTPLYEVKHGYKYCWDRKLCCECGSKLKGRRTRWCGQACVDQYLIRSDPQVARRHVFDRDQGVCALCAIDTDEIRERIKAADKIAFAEFLKERNAQNPNGYTRDVLTPNKWAHLGYKRDRGPWTHVGLSPGGAWNPGRGSRRQNRILHHHDKLAEFVEHNRFEALRGTGFERYWYRKTFWDMDHILPVAQGGGECGLENLQSLCLPCHSKKSAKAARKKARAKAQGRVIRLPTEECEFTRACSSSDPHPCEGCVSFRQRARARLASK